MSELAYKKCDLCHFRTNTTDDVYIFGDWMHSHRITVHYFCLLLATNLPQKGRDCAGILGFLIKDIRVEIRNAAKRICSYCAEPQATISCYNCQKYFHLVCGHRYECSFIFINDFRSYCHECVPLDEFQLKFMDNNTLNIRCDMCQDQMGSYNPITMVHAKCCGNGFVHRMCMRKYALAAGYYLRCIWCRSKEFRDHVRLLGVFVPDRDAQWEQKNAYASLHRGHSSCNMEVCHCPKGRDYSVNKWKIIVCSLCGSFGAHNPKCIPGHENQKTLVTSFKCNTCYATEVSIANQSMDQPKKPPLQERMNLALHMTKAPNANYDTSIHETPNFSSDETISSVSTAITVRQRSSVLELNNDSSALFQKQQKTSKTPNESQKILCSKTHNAHFSAMDSNISQNSNRETINAEYQNTPKNVSSDHNYCNSANINTQNECSANDIDPNSSSGDNSGSNGKNIIEIENWPELDNDWNCIGSCTVRIDLNSPRFIGKSIEDIFESWNLVTDSDKIYRSTDVGVFTQIDKIIEDMQDGNTIELYSQNTQE